MSHERVASALISADSIHALQKEGVSQIEATRMHILDVYEEEIAGHDIWDKNNDRMVIIRDGLIRAINLERLTRGFLYAQRNKDANGNVIVDVAAKPHVDEFFSFTDIVHAYNMVRKRHNEMLVEKRGDTKTYIPELNRSLAHTFMQEQVAGRWLQLGEGRNLRDVDLQKMEDQKMFRFPPTEFERKPGEVEKEREALKQTAFSLLINERRGRVDISGKFEEAWFSASDLVGIYIGLKDNSRYAGEVGMYFSLTSAEAYIGERIEHYGLEETIVRKQYEYNGEIYNSKDSNYRQKPLK